MGRNIHRHRSNDSDKLTFTALGGLGEIGKNMYVLECCNEILIIDCGLKFPDSELPGVDYIVPDITYLEQNREKIRAIIITHGHEDHTGGLPYVLPRLRVPLYGTQLTLGLIRNKLQDDVPTLRPEYHEIRAGDIIKIGVFTVKFIAVAHSIPDGVALSIETPIGRILHTGDFKLDSTPVDGRVTDYGGFAEEGDKGIMLLLSDSTNAERKGFTPSERIITGTLDTLFRQYRTRRIIISSFASNVHRIQQVADVAARFNRKIAFMGRSMIRNAELARETGYLRIDSKMIITMEETWKYSDNQLVIITTGSQGEPFSGLVTMSRGENRLMELGEHDAVFLLASVIPGNEKLVNNTINRLFARGCEVVYERERQIHVSGHASAEELKIMLTITKPQYFVPIHGEYKHLVRHSQLAQEVGIPPRNIYLLENGEQLIFAPNTHPKKHGRIHSGAVIVDGNAAGSIKSEVLKERREIAEDGVMAIAVTVDERGKLISPVAIETQGVFISEDSPDIFKELYAVTEQAVNEISGSRANIEAVKKSIRTRARDVLRKRNSSFAVILPIVSVKQRDTNNIYEKEFF